MKKVVILLAFLFFSGQAYSADNCLKIEKKLWILQNQIVDKSFRQLSPGAWAKYSSNIKAVYLGKQISPKTGKKLYVIEYTGGPAGQIWYKLTPKDVTYQDKTFRYWTLEPMEAYLAMRGGVFYLSKTMIETYMRMTGGNSWSRILKEGSILPSPDCRDITEIKETTYTFPTGKRVKATVIRSKENGAIVYCSPLVPFGMINVKSSQENNSNGLIDYGFSDGKAKITKSMAANAKLFPVLPLNGNINPPDNFPKFPLK